MSKLFLYADPESLAVLADDSEKILLIGSDFGYGNFGDILQHVNTLQLLRSRKRFRIVCVFTMEVISSPAFPAWARQHYQIDAAIFVSGAPHFFRDADPGVEPVRSIRGLSALMLYGGGFLNALWGDFVLGVTEYFLDRFPGISYWISGQQITEPFEARVIEHATRYQPRLLGVRDHHSFSLLQAGGYTPGFSFDDATESLQALGRRALKAAQQGLFLHFNVSDYTANDQSVVELTEELGELRRRVAPGEDVTVLQAFRDRRESVRDTREAIKRLEIEFPFVDYRFAELAALCYPGADAGLHSPLKGAFGYSCSYHVALWLQLAGIPCYLRSRNSFYDQKAKALGVTQTYREFLDSPRLTDHRENLERRQEWLGRLSDALDAAPTVKAERSFDWSGEKDQTWLYYFKGTPTLQEKLQWWTNQANVAETQLHQLQAERGQLGGRVETLSAQLVQVGEEAASQRRRSELAEEQLRQVQEDNRDLVDRIEAQSVQLFQVSEEEASQRQRADMAESLLERARADNQQITERVNQIIASRSWRITKPLRAIARYAAHGHFDSEGKVSLFSLTQKIGRRISIPAQLRSSIGKLLVKLRRRG